MRPAKNHFIQSVLKTIIDKQSQILIQCTDTATHLNTHTNGYYFTLAARSEIGPEPLPTPHHLASTPLRRSLFVFPPLGTSSGSPTSICSAPSSPLDSPDILSLMLGRSSSTSSFPEAFWSLGTSQPLAMPSNSSAKSVVRKKPLFKKAKVKKWMSIPAEQYVYTLPPLSLPAGWCIGDLGW